jgi:hypothetical protein
MILYKAFRIFLFDLALDTFFEKFRNNILRFNRKTLNSNDTILAGDHFTTIVKKGRIVYRNCTIDDIIRTGNLVTIFFRYRNIDGDVCSTVVLDNSNEPKLELTP